MLLYAITDRTLLGNDESMLMENLVETAGSWAGQGVDFLQIREKDLGEAALTNLASAIMRTVRQHGAFTKVLLNAPAETVLRIASAAGMDGVHLRGGLAREDLAELVRRIRVKTLAGFVISVSCHSVADVRAARAAGATLALLGPVFEKALPGSSAVGGRGLEFLSEACRAGKLPGPHPPLPVLALGGVTLNNAPQCIAAGAAGIAAIRLFLNAEDPMRDWRQLVEKRGDAH
jgi:thiamine-phosphate pyrophosphorylase